MTPGVAQFRLLVVLEKLPQGATFAFLCHALQVTDSAVRKVIRPMRLRGLVSVTRYGVGKGSKAVITITDNGRAFLEETFGRVHGS